MYYTQLPSILLHSAAIVEETALPCAVSSLPTTNTSDVSAKANQLANFPLNFLRTGYYYFTNGQVDVRKTDGRWWSDTQNVAAKVVNLAVGINHVMSQTSNDRGFGFALRCGAKANQLANFPLNFLRTGNYNDSDGKLYSRTTHGYWWSTTRASATNANYLGTSPTDVYPQASGSRGNGIAMRWVVRAVTKANQLANFPLNFLRTGYYGYPNGKVGNRTAEGLWWSTNRNSATNANYLYTDVAGIYPQYTNALGYGFALRCATNSPSKYPHLSIGIFCRVLGQFTDGSCAPPDKPQTLPLHQRRSAQLQHNQL